MATWNTEMKHHISQKCCLEEQIPLPPNRKIPRNLLRETAHFQPQHTLHYHNLIFLLLQIKIHQIVPLRTDKDTSQKMSKAPTPYMHGEEHLIEPDTR